MAERKKRSLKNANMKSGDFMLVILTLALVIFGVIMVFSASYYYSINEYGDQYHYLKRDVIWAASGLIIMLFLATVDYRIYEKFAKPIMIVSIVMLVLIFTPLGVTRNNATRWIGVWKITFMPGEFAKISAIIFVAWYLSRDPARIRSFKEGVM
ncbi:MAG: FtsW/RodA/SpoVE family cell cycle protein, partial [Firmicutes bacterium]|nr:FtsW/RodA/SpoVE family cell cycle protein [Bacillota bacterium]